MISGFLVLVYGFLILLTPAEARINLPCHESLTVATAIRAALAPQLLVPSLAAEGPHVPDGAAICELALADFLRIPNQALADRSSEFDGPNCWGSALYLRGIRKRPGYAHDREFGLALDANPECRKLLSVETPTAGDIGAIRAGTPARFEELHGFIYLTPALAISKMSYAHDARLELTRNEAFHQRFGGRHREEECLAPGAPTDCTAWTSYYRCRPGFAREAALREETLFLGLLDSVEEELAWSWSDRGLAADPARMNALLELIFRTQDAMEELRDPRRHAYAAAVLESLIWQFTAIQYEQKTTLEPVKSPRP